MKAIKTPLIITSLRAKKDGSLGLSCETPELTSEQKVEFMNLQNNELVALFDPMNNAPEIKVEKDINLKSQAERIRSVLYLLWQKDNEGITYFDQYYTNKTEKYIDYLKGKLQ